MATRPKTDTPAEFDFRRGGELPAHYREIIETQLAIEAEDAKSAGQLGFMARALVIATMPYKDPKTDAFTRTNGDFKLRIVAGYEGGIPYGIYPRALMAWVSTEAVRKQDPVIELGDSLNYFLREVMGVQRGGGVRGNSTRVQEQLKRLFGSFITAQYQGTQEQRGFLLKNVMIAEELEIHSDEPVGEGELAMWQPQAREEAGRWKSKVRLTNGFFTECVTNPVPFDLRVYKALRERKSPLAMDLYVWLTYRMHNLQKRSRPIRWEALQMQFGSGYPADEQGRRDFKKSFLKALEQVSYYYKEAKVIAGDTGLTLLPSRPHVLPKPSSSRSTIERLPPDDSQPALF